MLAVRRRVLRCGVARAEAELGRAHEVCPLVDLLQGAERGREHEATDRVPVPVRAVRVELTALVAGGDVQLREVADAGDLHELARLQELHSLDRAVGDETRACTIPEAPCYFYALWVGRPVSVDLYTVMDEMRPSVFPMTDPAPGSGGAQRQKSSTALTVGHGRSVCE